MTETATLPRIDTDALRETVDIVAWIGREVELIEHKHGYHFGPCPFCEQGEDRFKVWPDTRLFNCAYCGRKGDVIEYQMEKHGYDFPTAAKSLLSDDVPTADNGKLTPRRPAQLEGEELAEYRARLYDLADRAAVHLLGAESEAARQACRWLQGRGLRLQEIARFNIGYNDKWRQIIPGYKLPPGVVLPRYHGAAPSAYAGGQAVAANVYLNSAARELTGYRRMFAKGSNAKSFFGGPVTGDTTAVILTEGELDCAILARFFPPHAHVAPLAVGGAGTIPEYLGLLDDRRVVLAFDNDEAGRVGVDRWRERLPSVTVATVPMGKDVTDFWKAGGDVAGWLDDVLRELPA